MANAQSPGTGGRDPRAPRARRSRLQALLYWGGVLGLWGVIFVLAFFAVFAVDLPDTSKLYDVKRQPSVSYLDRSPRTWENGPPASSWRAFAASSRRSPG